MYVRPSRHFTWSVSKKGEVCKKGTSWFNYYFFFLVEYASCVVSSLAATEDANGHKCAGGNHYFRLKRVEWLLEEKKVLVRPLFSY